jgi:hypothetical protein
MQRNLMIAQAILFLSLSFAPAAIGSEDKTWDQDRVSELAKEMAGEIKRVRAAARKEPHIISAGTTGKQRSAALYLDTLKKLERASAKLARQLGAGETPQETSGTARRVDSLLRDLDEQGAKLHSTEWTNQFLESAKKIAGELRSYYDSIAPDATPAK